VPKRGYSKLFRPTTDTYGRYLLDKIPATLWRKVRARSKKEGVSVRAYLLTRMTEWVQEEEQP
jgi:hypothetical protein